MTLSPAGRWDVARFQAQVKRWLTPRPRVRSLDPGFPRPPGSQRRGAPTPAIAPAAPQPRISIIIPALNEARNLPSVLQAMQAATQVEVVVVDGGSTDRTSAVAAAGGARVIESAPGRSHQMNQGAAVATGPLLLFLHADTRLPQGFEHTIRDTLAQPGVVAGAFQLAIDGQGQGLRWVEWGVNLRSRYLQLPSGDQGIFLTAAAFHQLGGFPDLPRMEDFELVRRLRPLGRIAIAPRAVVTSDRRWRSLGILRTTLANQAMVVGYLLGVDPQQLARWYRGLDKPRS
jgi:rSAM/selenodomain-associated transferase 2